MYQENLQRVETESATISNTIPQVITDSEVKPFALQVEETSYAFLYYLSSVQVISVLILIMFGALVTSNNAGLAVPDWPTTFGENMFTYPPSKWQGGIFYEHFHRLLASGVGIITLILTLCIWFKKQLPRPTKVWGSVLLFSVVVQGVLGGLTVLYLLPDAISVGHGMLGQTFFLFSILINYQISKLHKRSKIVFLPHKELVAALKYSLLFFGCLYLQLLLGAMMRHAEAGLAMLNFPTDITKWFTFDLSYFNELRRMRRLPDVNLYQLITHGAHRLWSVVALTLGIVSVIKLQKLRYSGHALLIAGCLMSQMILGIVTVLSIRHPIITSLHVVNGALLLGLSFKVFIDLIGNSFRVSNF